MRGYAEFVEAHPEIPWRGMRGLRNQVTHGYFDIDYDVIWVALQRHLPDLLEKLPPQEPST
jgi:uncharacterized protein with HEPN domain